MHIIAVVIGVIVGRTGMNDVCVGVGDAKIVGVVADVDDDDDDEASGVLPSSS